MQELKIWFGFCYKAPVKGFVGGGISVCIWSRIPMVLLDRYFIDPRENSRFSSTQINTYKHTLTERIGYTKLQNTKNKWKHWNICDMSFANDSLCF